jgi:hypothetical protein
MAALADGHTIKKFDVWMIILAAVLVAVASPSFAQAPDAKDRTATLKGSGYCRIIGNLQSIRCSKDNVLTKGVLNSSPVLHLIDGKGPAEYQIPNGGPKTSWRDGKGFFVVGLAVGKHKLSLSYHANLMTTAAGTTVETGPVEEVEIEAAAQHSYELHAIEGNKGWIIYDVTNKKQQTATIIAGTLRVTLSLK